jgi:CRP-like cAMP-binding protein
MPDPSGPNSAPSANALIRKLERFSSFSDVERQAIGDLDAASEWIAPGKPIINAGDGPEMVLPLLEGLAYRHKDFRDGRRQILSLLLPGDICGGAGELSGPVDYGVRSLSRARIARIESARFIELLQTHPAIAIALIRSALVDEAVQRAWIVNLGQRHAHERIAHLLCELAHRMSDCGLILSHGGFELPLTQQELGSALGLTSVHTNRVLQQLRAEKLIEFQGGVVHIQDAPRLRALADFDAGYLS